MKNLKTKLLIVAMMLVVIMNVHSQTLDEIIEKNTQAIGGKEIIKSITSIYIENTIEVMGNESASTTIILNGKGIKTKSDVNGQSLIQCYTNKGGWMINPMAGSSDPAVMTKDEYKNGESRINVSESFMDYASKGNKVEFLGKEKFQNSDAFKIKVIMPDSVAIIYFIDASSYYVVQTMMNVEMMGQKMDVISKFNDYQKTDFGFVLPKTTTVNYGEQFSLGIKLKKAEFNKPVDQTIFDFGNLK